MNGDVDELFEAQGEVATTAQLLAVLTRSQLDTRIGSGQLLKVWPGVYSRCEPDTLIRLRGVDLRAGERVPICLGTAAAAYGFDTEDVVELHVLNPESHQLRKSDGLFVHRREGAPITEINGRPATTPSGLPSRLREACVVPGLSPRSTLRCGAARATFVSCAPRLRSKPADGGSSRCAS